MLATLSFGLCGRETTVDLNLATWWWLAAGALVAAELATGTFYLLMLAVGAVVGALSAHAGMGFTAQVVAAAVLGGGATAGWHFKRSRDTHKTPADHDRDVNLDIGQTVQVDQWASDGTAYTARVQYRGAGWAVGYEGTGQPAPGRHTIVAVQGSQLRVERSSSA